MDQKDFRLIAELFRSPLATHVQLGRAASISSTSARRRLEALERDQVIAGYVAIPAASTLGREAFLATASTQVATGYFPMRLLEVEDVVWAYRAYDGALTVLLYLPAGKEPAAAGFGADKGWQASRTQIPTPGADGALSEADWRIIEALIDHPREEVPGLSRKTGLTARTVQGRRERLLASGALQVRPVLLSPQGPGELLFDLFVRLKSPGAASNVQTAVKGGLLISESQEPAAALYLCHARSFVAVQDLQQKLAAHAEVAEVRFTLNREAAIARDRVRGWVRAAIEQRRRTHPKTDA